MDCNFFMFFPFFVERKVLNTTVFSCYAGHPLKTAILKKDRFVLLRIVVVMTTLAEKLKPICM